MIVKRCFDLVIGSVLLVVLCPLLVLIAVTVAATSGRPVIYRARRVGRGGQSFLLLKFRTMRVGIAGPAITGREDPRITPIGAVLRRTKLDELPQLLNVLRGDMSLVGPRPEDPRFAAGYSPEQREVLSIRPGITSPAAVRYRDEETLLKGGDPKVRGGLRHHDHASQAGARPRLCSPAQSLVGYRNSVPNSGRCAAVEWSRPVSAKVAQS